MAAPIPVIYVAVQVATLTDAKRLQDWLDAQPMEDVGSDATIMHGVIRDNLFHEEAI